jgi:hypothetical protein
MNNMGCSLPIMTVFSAVVAASFTYTGILYSNSVLIVFGIIQILVTLAGVYAMIRNHIKDENTQPPDEKDEAENN